MYRHISILLIFIGVLLFHGCSTSYKAKPLPFKTPTSYDNAVTVAGTQVAAKAFNDVKQAKEVFGFDIHGAGMLPEPPWGALMVIPRIMPEWQL